MSYLSDDEFKSIYDNVKIYSIMSNNIKDINEYSFDCGEAKEYEIFLKEEAILLETKCITKSICILK